MKIDQFQELIWQQGNALYRPMPWRDDTRPYYVLVSELMLQQTQVDRVIPKFNAFITRFPDEAALAASPLSDVLTLWSGLGYNRRAKFLHESARKIMTSFAGCFPGTEDELLSLPGVGPGTAGAIRTYAFNQPVVFIETNIRTVYLHHFFALGGKIHDTEIAKIVDRTLDRECPRDFYWALMDYGTWLKKQGLGKITQSVHYKKQSALQGSIREVRGQIVRLLSTSAMPEKVLAERFVSDGRFIPALDGLMRDGLVTRTKDRLHLTK